MTETKITPEPPEAEKFDAGVRKILSASHEELRRREEQWKREQRLLLGPLRDESFIGCAEGAEQSIHFDPA
jgi:hypothetical protein